MPGASGALNQEFAVSRRERRRDAAEVALSDSLSELVAGRGVVIHDRLLPNGHTIIDHIAVTGAGVFVISVEPMRGKLELRNVGKRRKPDQRLFVAGEDRTLLVAETRHCAGAVRLAVDPGGTGSVPIRRILCFVNTTWERKATPLTLDGVHVTWADEVLEQLAKDGPLPKDRIGALGEAISTALPAAGG